MDVEGALCGGAQGLSKIKIIRMQQILLFIGGMRPKQSCLRKESSESQLGSNLIFFKRKNPCSRAPLSLQPRLTSQNRKVSTKLGICLEGLHSSQPSRDSFSRSCAGESLKLMFYLKQKGQQKGINNGSVQKTELQQRFSSNFEVSERVDILSVRRQVNKQNLEEKGEVKLRKMGLKKLVEKPKFNPSQLANGGEKGNGLAEQRIQILQAEVRRQEELLSVSRQTSKCQQEDIGGLSLELQETKQLTRKLVQQNTQLHVRYRSEVDSLRRQLEDSQGRVRLLGEQLRAREAEVVSLYAAQLGRQGQKE